MASTHLCLHRGGIRLASADLKGLDTPKATPTWQPISHHWFSEQVKSSLAAVGFRVKEEEHGINATGDEYFGLLFLDYLHKNVQKTDEFDMIAGLRNCHDMRFSAGVCWGNRVFVCDNLAFIGEVQIKRKHTRFILRDLPMEIRKATARLDALNNRQKQLVEQFQKSPLNHDDSYCLLTMGVEHGVIPSSHLKPVLDHWKEEERRTAWGLFNCFTAVMKEKEVATSDVSERTIRLNALLEDYLHEHHTLAV